MDIHVRDLPGQCAETKIVVPQMASDTAKSYFTQLPNEESAGVR